MTRLNATHDPVRRSWVESANQPGCDFPIQNLPFGVFHREGQRPCGGVAIGDQIFSLAESAELKIFSGLAAEAAQAAAAPALNDLMALGQPHASALREQLSDFLRADGRERPSQGIRTDRLLVPMREALLDVPARIGAFTDFLCSIYHLDRMRRGRDLPPAFKYLPIAYNSRASSVRVSENIRRPRGEYSAADGETRFGPEPSLDFELEVAAFIGHGNALGDSIPIAQAADHIFGYSLLNDWSARGIQMWESQPLGPFLGKSFSTSISPWIVTAEALAPFRAPAFARAAGDPEPMAHLSLVSDQEGGSFDVGLEAYLLTPKMKERGLPPARVTRTNVQNFYWTFAQMVAHHTSNGCNLRPGDLLASGTASGPTDDSRACIAELNGSGTKPILLTNDETRMWLEDGDEVTFRARAERHGHVAIGFGECRGRIVPAES
jgi:fumarylacetoacetase